jgi:acyl-CoA synthetase (AMP-forming)/AMP-acid ligase II
MDDGAPATIPQLLELRRAGPDSDFLVTDQERLTFAEAESRSQELAGALLASGVGKGTRVGVLFPNSAQWLVSWLACMYCRPPTDNVLARGPARRASQRR